jgi:hypothetical protein
MSNVHLLDCLEKGLVEQGEYLCKRASYARKDGLAEVAEEKQYFLRSQILFDIGKAVAAARRRLEEQTKS